MYHNAIQSFKIKSVKSTIFLLLMTIALFSHSLSAQIIFVNHQANGDNDGTSWQNAFNDLQLALAASEAGNEIWVAQGVYYPDSEGTDRNRRFIIPDGVGIYGGFSGNEENRDERDWNLFITELSGDINRTGNFMGNSHTVVDVSGTSSSTILDGFVITRGNAEILSNERYPLYNTGAGIFNEGGSPLIRNCIITTNQGIQGGGMANLFNANPTLENVIFRNNTVIYPGGGGAMLNSENSNPVIISCLFRNNRSAILGGAILNVYSSSPEIWSSQFILNRALSGAGVYSLERSNSRIINSSFRGNVSQGSGGAIGTLSNSQLIMENCLLAGNMGIRGAGIYADNASVLIYNNTFAGNVATEDGAAVFAGSGVQMNIYNSILWNNRSYNGVVPDFGVIYHGNNPARVRVHYSIVEGSYAPDAWNVRLGVDMGGNKSFNPLFANPSPTLGTPFTDGDYSLTECSPAINKGRNQLIGNFSITDIEGKLRIIDEIVDMGAYEYDGEVPPPEVSCEDFVMELNFQPSFNFDIDEFFEVIDSCGPVISTIVDLDSLILDCTMVGSHTYTVIVSDLFTGLSDTCEVSLEVKNPTYRFTINEQPVTPGDTISICPELPLRLGIDSTMRLAAPLDTELKISESGNIDQATLSLEDYFLFSYSETDVYQLQFQSIRDANGCTLEGEEAEQYYFYFNVAVTSDTSYHTASLCVRDHFRDVKIDSDTILQYLHLSSRGCDSLEIIEISIYDSPELKIIGDTLVCAGESGTLSVTETFEQLEWSLNTQQTSEIQFFNSGEISVIAIDEFGCTFSKSINVTVLDPIDLNYEITPSNCEASMDGFIALNEISGGLPPYQPVLINENGEEISNFSQLNPGWYQMQIQDANDCKKEKAIDIPEVFTPLAEIVSPSRIDKGDSLNLWVNNSFPHQVDVSWYVNDEPFSFEGDSISLQPNDDIEVVVILIDSLGCKAKAKGFIEVYEPIEIYIPNAFSPNHDGVNDRFSVYTRDGDQVLSLRVYDRWGAVIFERKDFPANNPDYGWDGTFRNQNMPTGEYLYHLKLLDDNEIRQFVGTVLLVR